MGVRREGQRCVPSTARPLPVATMMKYGEFMVSTVSINDTNNGVIQRIVTIADPKVSSYM